MLTTLKVYAWYINQTGAGPGSLLIIGYLHLSFSYEVLDWKAF